MMYCEYCTSYCSLCIIFVSFWYGRRTSQYVLSLLLLSTVLWTHNSFESSSKRDPQKVNCISQVNFSRRQLWEDGLDLGCPASAIWRLVDCDSQYSSVRYFQGLQGWTLLIRLKGEFSNTDNRLGKKQEIPYFQWRELGSSEEQSPAEMTAETLGRRKTLIIMYR